MTKIGLTKLEVGRHLVRPPPCKAEEQDFEIPSRAGPSQARPPHAAPPCDLEADVARASGERRLSRAEETGRWRGEVWRQRRAALRARAARARLRGVAQLLRQLRLLGGERGHLHLDLSHARTLASAPGPQVPRLGQYEATAKTGPLGRS